LDKSDRAQGELFHVAYPVLDRSRAGMPVSEEHFRRYLVPAMKYIAFAPGAQQDILSRFPESNCRIELDGLPGWDVYQRCADP
jgi:hypothetical protein